MLLTIAFQSILPSAWLHEVLSEPVLSFTSVPMRLEHPGFLIPLSTSVDQHAPSQHRMIRLWDLWWVVPVESWLALSGPDLGSRDTCPGCWQAVHQVDKEVSMLCLKDVNNIRESWKYTLNYSATQSRPKGLDHYDCQRLIWDGTHH